MSLYEANDYDLEAEPRPRRRPQPADDTNEIIRRRGNERSSYYEDEERPSRRRGTYEEDDDVPEPRRRRIRRDDISERDRREREVSYEDPIVEAHYRRRKSPSPRSRGNNSYRAPYAEDDYSPSPPIPRRRRNDSYRSPYADADDSPSSSSPPPPPPPRGWKGTDRYLPDDLPQPQRWDRSRFEKERRSPPREPSSESSASSASNSPYRSSSEEESVESRFPKKGKTRVPAGLVSKMVLIDLGYPFEEDDDVIIIQKALGHESIEELIRLSEADGIDGGLGFVPPLDREGKSLQFDVNLGPQLSDNKGAWNNATIGPAAQPWETLSLAESRAYTDEAGGEKIILTLDTKDSSTGGTSGVSTSGSTQSRLRWIHMKDEHMSIKSLEHLISRAPGLNSDDVVIALRLLGQVAEKAEKPYIHGRYLQPIVLRGDGRSVGSRDRAQRDRHCTFINFPHFSLQAPSSPPPQRLNPLHTVQGLLQTMYLLESTKLRDEEQAICKLQPDKYLKHSIHVPQLWSIVIGSGKYRVCGNLQQALITYSTHSLPVIHGRSIEVQKPVSKKQSGPSNLRVTDPYQRVFFFPIESCKTWFELEELVYTQCELGSCSSAKIKYDILLPDNKPVSGATWPAVLASEETPFVDIAIHLKTFQSEDSDDSGSGLDYDHARKRSPMGRRSRSRYYSDRNKFPLDPWSQGAAMRRGASSIGVTRGGTRDSVARWGTRDSVSRRGTKNSRRSTQRSRRSRSRLRIGKENSVGGLGRTAVLAMQEKREAKQSQERKASDFPEAPDVNRLASINEGADQDIVPGDGAGGVVEEGTAAAENPDAKNDDSEGSRVIVPEESQTTPHILEDNSRNPDSSDDFFCIRDFDEGIVAEPESYIPTIQPQNSQQNQTEDSSIGHSLPAVRQARTSLPAFERRRSSYARGDSMALVPYEERQPSVQYGDLPAARDNARPYSFNPRPAPPRRRRRALESTYKDARVRPRWPSQLRERDLPMGQYTEIRPRPPPPVPLRYQTSNLPPLYEDRHTATPYYRRDTDECNRISSRTSCRPYRYPRGTPAPDGIVTNAILFDDLTSDMYYTPKKDADSVPIVNIPANPNVNGDGRPSEEERQSRSERLNHRDSMSSQVRSGRSSESKASRKKQRSESFTKLSPEVKLIKSSVLPILMWPTGPVTNSSGSENDDIHSDILFDEKLGPGPPRTPKPVDTSQTGNCDQSMQEILERVYNSMLTDRSNRHDRLFMEMETAHLKDAKYTLPEQQVSAATNQEDSSASKDEALAGKSKSGSAAEFLSTNPTTTAKPASPEIPEYQTKLLQFASTANELLGFFIPADYSNAVIGRYYGSIKRIVEAVDKFQKHNEISRLYTNLGAVFVIEDIGFDVEKHHLRPLSKPLGNCSKCKGRFSYKNDIDASNHLVSDHFEPDRLPKPADVKLWIKKYHPLCDKRRCEEHFRILKNCCSHLDVIHSGIQEIRDGVRTVGTTHNQRYRLPKALVEVFRKLVILLVYTSHVLDLITKYSDSWTHPKWRLQGDPDVSEEVLYLQTLGYSIEETVDQGKLDLMLMIRTQDYTQSIRRHEAVGPQYILAMVLSHLQHGVKCSDLLDVYKDCVERLSFQVSQFPRRRLLRSLKNVSEEIESIIDSKSSQHNLLVDLLKVLNPQSFRRTTEARISLFDLERHLVEQGIARHFQQKVEYIQLIEHVLRLMETTKTSVEINDDDHGKAILVFTIVTLVFLPLSFVTSFLGMNTIDIRNQNSTQSLFWIVALPITAVVVIMALIIGYKYEVMREWAEKNLRKVKKE